MKLKFSIFIILGLLDFSSFSQSKTSRNKKETIAEVEKLSDDFMAFIDSVILFLKTEKKIATDDKVFATPYINEKGDTELQDYHFNLDIWKQLNIKRELLIGRLQQILPDSLQDNYHLKKFRGTYVIDSKTGAGVVLYVLNEYKRLCLEMKHSLVQFKSKNMLKREIQQLYDDYISYIYSVKEGFRKKAGITSEYHIRKYDNLEPLKYNFSYYNGHEVVEKTTALLEDLGRLSSIKMVEDSYLYSYIDTSEYRHYSYYWNSRLESISIGEVLKELNDLQMQCKQLWCEIYNEFIEGAKPLSYQESHDSLFGQFFIIKDLKGNIVINNKALIEIYPKKCSYVDIHEVTVNGIPCKFSKGYWLYESDTIRNLWENELFFEIKYRSTDGILKVLTDIHYLSVFRPRIIVSTTSDKTLLIGLMNNVNVFVSGCNPEDIQVAFEGATGVRKEVLGEYYVEVGSQSRNVIVKVFFKGGCIGTDTLKVIPVSNMSCLLNNHWGSLISKENLVIVDSLKLYWPIDIANNKYWSTIDIDISTYSCTIIGKNKESTFHVKGNKFTKQMVGKFKKCSQNDIIVFNQIIGKRTYKGLLTDKIYPLVLTIK